MLLERISSASPGDAIVGGDYVICKNIFVLFVMANLAQLCNGSGVELPFINA